MKNILVPTDFSECANAAVEYALELAKTANAEIHFLHMQFTPIDWVDLPLEKEKQYPEVKAQIGHSKDKLNKLVRRAEKTGLKAKQFLVYDKGKEEINRHIDHHKHDFIVMGSHGGSGIKELIGTNTQKVVRYSRAPVLVVKQKPKEIRIKNIVFASDFEEDVKRSFKKVLELAELTSAETHLLYVNTPYNFKETDEAREKVLNFLKKCPKGTCSVNVYDGLNEQRGIQKFADEINADVIALATHGKTGFLKMVSPSITENLVNHSDKPVLSIHINQQKS